MTDLPSVSPRPRIRAIPQNTPIDDHSPGPGVGAGDPRLLAEPGKPHRKREANSGSFKAGVSGNPKGRPRKAKGVKAMVRKALSATVPIKTSKGAKKVPVFEALVKKEVSLAAEGDWRARRTVFELGKWVMGSDVEPLLTTEHASPEALSETGKAIIEWFKDEVTTASRGDAADHQVGEDK